MPNQHAYDENRWRLRRIRQLWAELRITRAETPLYYELVARIRHEAEAYNGSFQSSQSGPANRVAGPSLKVFCDECGAGDADLLAFSTAGTTTTATYRCRDSGRQFNRIIQS